MKNYGDLCKKFSSRRGAAMLIALLVFFLAALSGTIALTMAASNAGRYTHEKDDQQAYLSVVSAANLILSRLDGLEIKYTAPSGSPQPDDITVSYNNTKNSTKHEDLFLADDGFKECLQAFSSPQGKATTFEFSLSVSNASEMGTVDVILDVYSSIFNFRLYSADGDNRDYQITMQVGTKFTDGVGNFTGGNGVYSRTMEFDTDKVSYTVEEGYEEEDNEENQSKT